MKTLNVMLLVILLGLNYTAQANDKYKTAVKKNVDLVYQAKDIAEYQAAVNALERIAAAEPTRWEASYYVGFAYIMMSTKESDNVKKDAFLDLAQAAVDKAKALVPEESEVISLEGFVYMMRIPIDPATRGMKFAPMATKAFEKAVALNENNPRALGLKAQMAFGAAQFFGSPTDAACATNAKALEKFGTFVPSDELTPMWGKGMVEDMTKNCQ